MEQIKLREELLQGNLNLSIKESKIGTRLLQACWYNYLAKGGKGSINLPYWAEQFSNPVEFNQVLIVLSNTGWINTKALTSKNWGEASINKKKLLEIVSNKELIGIRNNHKIKQYLLSTELDNEDYSKYTKTPNGVEFRITKKGFAKAAKCGFSFDPKLIIANKTLVINEVNKGIEKTIAEYPHILADINYRDISNEVVDAYINNNNTVYYANSRCSDSRGRDISGMLNKVGNPIGYKVMRSCLKIPKHLQNTATDKGLEAKYLFIATLNGFKEGSYIDKVEFGMVCYDNRTKTHNPVENIWIEAQYIDIDGYLAVDGYQWVYPVEIDCSASILAIFGLLLNHKPFMKATNTLSESGFYDPWNHNIITNRDQYKTIMQTLYGSSKSPEKVWASNGIPYTVEEVIAYKKELSEGSLAVAVKFKDFIINNCTMKETMNLTVWKQKGFTVECNKYKREGETVVLYDIYDSNTKSINRITHTNTKKVPDLESFKLWSVTGLIHSLDGQVLDNVCDTIASKYRFVVPIHDALILCAEAANTGRKLYAKQLTKLHTDRKQILQDYFRSINIGKTGEDFQNDVLSYVEPFEGEFNCSSLVLK